MSLKQIPVDLKGADATQSTAVLGWQMRDSRRISGSMVLLEVWTVESPVHERRELSVVGYQKSFLTEFVLYLASLSVVSCHSSFFEHSGPYPRPVKPWSAPNAPVVSICHLSFGTEAKFWPGLDTPERFRESGLISTLATLREFRITNPFRGSQHWCSSATETLGTVVIKYAHQPSRTTTCYIQREPFYKSDRCQLPC